MRRLGQALDRDPMAIYRHAADKDALLDGVIEHVTAELVTRREPDSNGTRIGKRFMHHTAHTFVEPVQPEPGGDHPRAARPACPPPGCCASTPPRWPRTQSWTASTCCAPATRT